MRRVWERFRNLALRDDLFFVVVYAPLCLGISLLLIANGAWPNEALFYPLMLAGILSFGLSILVSGIRLKHGRGWNFRRR